MQNKRLMYGGSRINRVTEQTVASELKRLLEILPFAEPEKIIRPIWYHEEKDMLADCFEVADDDGRRDFFFEMNSGLSVPDS